jgi:hypothetical protein
MLTRVTTAPAMRPAMVLLYLVSLAVAAAACGGCAAGEAGRTTTPLQVRALVRVEVHNNVGAGGTGLVSVNENAAPGSASSVPTSTAEATATQETSPTVQPPAGLPR